MSDYNRWKDAIEKHDREDGICPLLDDVFEQGIEYAIDELMELLPDCDMVEIEHLICLMEKVKGNKN